MNLRRRNPIKDWKFPPRLNRARVLVREGLSPGRIAILAAALLIAYLALSSSFSSGEANLGVAGDACENAPLGDETQQTGDSLNGSCGRPALAHPVSVPAPAAVVPANVARAPAAAVPAKVATACDDPGYEATLISPPLPGSSDTYTYVIDGCQPDAGDLNVSTVGVQWLDIDHVELSGCWEIDDIKDVSTSAGSAVLAAPGYVFVTGISDDDMPLTVEITFPSPLENGAKRTWIWVHTGPSLTDGWTYRTGGPFCAETSPTPAPTPSPEPTLIEPATSSPAPSLVAELTIAKTDSPDPVEIDGALAYTVTVSNGGAITAANVVVTDTLPDHVTLISSTPSQGSCDGITCFLGSIAPGEAAEISYIALVDEGVGSPFANVVCVMTSTTEGDLTNNCDEEETKLKIPLAATSTPDDVPTMGGNPLDGGSAGLSLLLLAGAGLTAIGAVAVIAARRRITNR